jgi:alkylmercury lyase
MTEPTTALHSLADGLAGTFPACDDAPLARALLVALARGEPVTDEQLAADTQRPVAEVTVALGRWPNVHRDDGGAVVEFSGLSLRPTKHRFAIGGRQLFTWCAWDTLFLPELLDEPAEIWSTCPLTGTRVRLRVDDGGVTDAEPEDLWVTLPSMACTSTADIVESFCCHVHFVAGHDTAQRWLRDHPDGHILDLRDAYKVGQRATAALRTGTAAHR